MRTDQDIVRAIEQFIREQFPLARQLDVERNTSLIENGVVDSLGTLEIVNFIEAEFQITMTDEEMLSEHFDSINSLAAFVAARLNRDKPVSSDS